MTERYVVSDHVEHGCCYEVAVRDTAVMDILGRPELVAEFSDREMAERVTALLNQQSETRQ